MRVLLKSFVRYVLGSAIMSSRHSRRLAWRAGRSLHCMARGEQLVDDMKVDGELELQGRVVAANHASARFVAFDVGANQGDWTLALMETFEKAGRNSDRLEAHVFEPVPTTHERLTKCLNIRRRGNVHINSVAASDRTGTLDMVLMSDTGGTNSLVYDKAMVRQALGFVSVPVTTIDLYCKGAGIEHIHILKCDTEGHDLSVLRGATYMLGSGRIDVFQFEYNHRWIAARAFLKDVFDLIENFPYLLGRITPTGVEIFDSWHPELERYYQSNYAIIREEVLPWLKITRGKFDKANTYA